MAQPKVITREEAKARGLKRYFTGVPCPHGHVAERSISNAHCIICRRESARRWETKFPEKAREKGRRYRVNNLEKYNKQRREHQREKYKRLTSNPHSQENSILIAKVILTRVKARAKRIGIEFSLIEKDILPLPIYCPVLGYKLSYLSPLDAKGHRLKNLASLDRTNGGYGYVVGNVSIMSYRANMLKNNATIEELRAVLFYCERCSDIPY